MKLDKIIAVRTNKTIYRDGDYVIKVFDDDFSKSDILNEALNQARVEEIGLKIPKIESVTKVDGKWAIVSEYIAGKTLARLMEENPDRTDEYFNLFVDLQLEVQSNTSIELNRLKDSMEKKISQADLLATTRYDLHTRLQTMPKHNKICHGDFNPGNIIIREDGEAYILDWSHVTRGNASADAARTYLYFRLDGNDEYAKKYIDLFCEKSGNSKQYVRKWIPIVAVSQSVTSKPDERERLLSLVDAVDYEL